MEAQDFQFNYGTAGGLNDVISRLASLSDTSGTLESYDYLGLSTVVRRAHSQPGVDLTYIKQTGEANGDAGDQYTGLDRFGRVVDQRWLVTSNGTHTDRFQYGYDRNSNALYRNNLVNTAFGELYHASGAANGYDNLNQLSGFLRGVLTASGGSGTPLDTVASPSHSQSWTPDALGNFSSVTTDGTAVNRTHNQQNEVTGVGASTLVFDKNGNMTTDEQGRTLVYDAWNRLMAVKNGSTTLASYKFDGLGRRIVETAGTNTRDLFFENWNVLEERLNSVSTADVQYLWSPVYVNALVLRDRSTMHNGTLDERLWVQQDANWKVTALLNTSGTAIERYVYDAYGLVTYLNATWGTLSGSAYDSRVLFQGERLDPAIGLYHMNYRDYSATLQRFVSTDPSGFAAGDNDLYRFTGNDPATMVDPTGLAQAVHLGNGTLIRKGNEFEFVPDPPPGSSGSSTFTDRFEWRDLLPPVAIFEFGYTGVVKIPLQWIKEHNVNVQLDESNQRFAPDPLDAMIHAGPNRFKGPDGSTAGNMVNGTYDPNFNRNNKLYTDDIRTGAHIAIAASPLGLPFAPTKIIFGHGARHLAETGLSESAVEAAIRSHIMGSGATGSYNGFIKINDTWIQYRAHFLPNGTLNVGTYFPVKGNLSNLKP
jgi:RHS repeat-associated protein